MLLLLSSLLLLLLLLFDTIIIILIIIVSCSSIMNIIMMMLMMMIVLSTRCFHFQLSLVCSLVPSQMLGYLSTRTSYSLPGTESTCKLLPPLLILPRVQSSCITLAAPSKFKANWTRCVYRCVFGPKLSNLCQP